ncbi:hypothetical protein J1G42_00905 [Cellulomonas sp. zg-ZUI222]|uniref:Uncharacterized protein n=1 Tax=Cellulomonas wangleii TaxID=2816956 RepID=A0ABX8D4R8_9CELL|nr:hypothetical protein [Cellulomonas wangleii]MBO0919385.1 hypothetical protein [Cellulomonas wangleii]MBO0924469.1 hypothetical protein [Cellulomonas wangleii]QVI62460.1 hypothetical protein KG103_00410 [Cellulomonas wangleii]
MSSIMIEPGTMLPAPPLSRKPVPAYSAGKLGFAEVKPHNVRGVLAGLKSIQKHKAEAKQPYQQAFLLTYRHQPGDLAPRAVMPYLLVPTTTSTTPPARPADKDLVAWLGRLGDWYALSPAPLALPAHTEPRWGRDVGPVVRGSMVEPLVRYAFYRFSNYRDAYDLTPKKQPQQKGADVAWKEIAEYLYELASELGSVG